MKANAVRVSTTPDLFTRPLEVDVHYQPIIPGEVTPAVECKHGGMHSLVVNNRIEGEGASAGIRCDALLCLACGGIIPFLEYRHYWDALSDFWTEHGWHRGLGARLSLFAELGGLTPVEQFFALHSGLSPEETARHLAGQPIIAETETT